MELTLLQRADALSKLWQDPNISKIQLVPRSWWMELAFKIFFPNSSCKNKRNLNVIKNDGVEELVYESLQLSEMDCDYLELYTSLQKFSEESKVLCLMPFVQTWNPGKQCEQLPEQDDPAGQIKSPSVLTMCQDFQVSLQSVYRLWGNNRAKNQEAVMQVVLYVARLLCCLHMQDCTFDTSDTGVLIVVNDQSNEIFTPILSSLREVLPKGRPIGEDFKEFISKAVLPSGVDFSSWFSVTDLGEFWKMIVDAEREYLINPMYLSTIKNDQEFYEKKFIVYVSAEEPEEERSEFVSAEEQ